MTIATTRVGSTTTKLDPPTLRVTEGMRATTRGPGFFVSRKNDEQSEQGPVLQVTTAAAKAAASSKAPAKATKTTVTTTEPLILKTTTTTRQSHAASTNSGTNDAAGDTRSRKTDVSTPHRARTPFRKRNSFKLLSGLTTSMHAVPEEDSGSEHQHNAGGKEGASVFPAATEDPSLYSFSPPTKDDKSDPRTSRHAHRWSSKPTHHGSSWRMTIGCASGDSCTLVDPDIQEARQTHRLHSLRRRRNSDFQMPKIVTTRAPSGDEDWRSTRQLLLQKASVFSQSVELRGTHDSTKREARTINDANIVGPGFVDLPDGFLRSPTARILQPNVDLNEDARSVASERLSSADNGEPNVATTGGMPGASPRPGGNSATSRDAGKSKIMLLDRMFGDNRKDPSLSPDPLRRKSTRQAPNSQKPSPTHGSLMLNTAHFEGRRSDDAVGSLPVEASPPCSTRRDSLATPPKVKTRLLAKFSRSMQFAPHTGGIETVTGGLDPVAGGQPESTTGDGSESCSSVGRSIPRARNNESSSRRLHHLHTLSKSSSKDRKGRLDPESSAHNRKRQPKSVESEANQPLYPGEREDRNGKHRLTVRALNVLGLLTSSRRFSGSNSSRYLPEASPLDSTGGISYHTPKLIKEPDVGTPSTSTSAPRQHTPRTRLRHRIRGSTATPIQDQIHHQRTLVERLVKEKNRADYTMGNMNCCGERPETTAKSLAKNPSFLTNKLTDLELFDEAYSNNDVRALIKLVSSKETFGQHVGDNLHPWASPPRTVGALATTQLAALAASEDMSIKERLRSANVIPLLVKELASTEEDRADAALVALSFLSIDFPKACIEMFEQRIFPPLINLLNRPKNGVKAAAAQTARNIYVLEVRYRRAFRDAGGCQPLVDLLDLPTGEYDPTSLDLQVEAVYHIDDFIMVNRVCVQHVSLLLSSMEKKFLIVSLR